VEHPGDGPRVVDDRYVWIDYRCSLSDGTLVADSTNQERPFVLRMRDDSTAVPGLRVGVARLREGDRAQIEVPAAQAYAEIGKASIPPNSNLVFEVEVVAVFERSESGLQFHVIERGEAPRASPGDHVVVEWSGRLLESGREFGSSRQRHRPEEFRLGEGTAIAGWEEGLRLLGKGGRAMLAVPPDLAYGQFGRLPRVPPKTDLFYEISLLGVRDV